MNIYLPFKQKPIIDTYSYHANIVSIVEQHSDLKPWIYHRFLRLAYCIDNDYLDFCDGDYFDYYRCNIVSSNNNKYYAEYRNHTFLDEYDITDDVLINVGQSIIRCLDKGFYVIIHLDHYYIEASDAYHKRNKNHETIVYGYDISEQIFYVSDNFISGKYVSVKVKFAEMELARRSSESIDLKRVLQVGIKRDQKVEMNIEEIYNKLRDYIEGKDSSSYGIITYDEEEQYVHNGFKYNWHWPTTGDMFVYGIDIHRFFIEDLENIRVSKSKLDVRRYHTMLNHKVVLMEFVNSLSESSFIGNIEELRLMLEESKAKNILARNTAIKYNITQDSNLIDLLVDFHKWSLVFEAELIRRIMFYLVRRHNERITGWASSDADKLCLSVEE
ncbi:MULTISPECIES: BtrH N-terminal domain-containing protein [Paenibacillus]|uniref:Uncharacterized protein n=1 Tax=Paenibacillus cucumis (ex Kampfer et al. 2016) TaxID=1776858 RepID=A0ABS7KNZ7_9BACL|nr:BtrH N-terminal domain-containing protein [Paenibacillus cucumis (ex Kampfer et al. 2016)]MBY0205900.1 hypothetical protein [Paenibacillus cucumis (ex Kampfer et al. 2016)]